MKDNDKDIQMIDSFLKERKQKIEDNGFSDRLMNRIPQGNRSFVIIYLILGAISVGAFIKMNGLKLIWNSLAGSFADITLTMPHLDIQTVAVLIVMVMLGFYTALFKLID